MPEEFSPTVARRHVRLALRDARERAGLTQPQVAEAMEWSVSKVIRIETGDVSIAPNDLRPLLSFLEVRDRDTVAELIAIAKIARSRRRTEWYHAPEFREHLSDAILRLIEYESEAVEIRYYQVYFMPGPLQVPAYARANLDSFGDDVPATTRRVRADARERRRQTMLSRLGRGLTAYALLDESVFLRPIGGTEVFREQLRFLSELAADGRLRMRMVPFKFDAAVTNNATFDLLTLSSEGRGEVLYRESGLHDEIVEDQSVARHRRRFDKIWDAAVPEDDTLDYLRSRLTDLTGW
ncbi:helix-turn-helix domain-containing protein [Actinoplanes sp. CA-030573]|uniref:helix-turn-helix domain-containing protein n=1 Tax=Actinoplanes sp. CA-030573 TaxID=3239898 RepID=UPI003D9021A0